MSEKGLELLAPAGDIKILKAVICNGADAVYFAGELFGARAYAKNFSLEESREAIRFAKLFNKKVYLTVNTLIKNIEFEKNLYDYLKYYYEIGIDAFIVQDIGLFNFIKENFPNIELHISTQVSISNSYGASFFKKIGADRLVLSRELSLKEIKNIYDKTHMDLEVFVHGAICVCYSGNCFMSSFFGGRSGNRGRCAQPCRLPYNISYKNKNVKNKYLISPSDMCLIDMIKELSEMGAYSLKIEGRMKSLSYAAGVVSMYRKYIDLYLENREKYKVKDEDKEYLRKLGERGNFTKTYLTKHNGKDMMSFNDSSFHNSKVSIDLKDKISLPIDIKVTLKKDEKIKLTIIDKDNKESTYYGDTVLKAKNRPLTKDDVKKKLLKTNDTIFSVRNIDIFMESDVFLPVSSINSIRRDALESFTQGILEKEEEKIRKERKVSDNNNPFIYEPIKTNTDNKIKYIVSCINNNQLEVILKYKKYIDTVILDHNFLSYDNDYFNKLNGIKLCFKMPDVYRKDSEVFFIKNKFKDKIKYFDTFMATTFDTIAFLQENGIFNKRIILDHRLYTFNNYSVSFFKNMGFLYDTIPLELNYKEISHRNNANSIIIVYGRAPLMIMANCTKKNIYGCDRKSGFLSLKDRKNISFPIRNDCSICMNTIYNSLPTDLFNNILDIKNVGCDKVRIDFTSEDSDLTDKILKEYFNYVSLNIDTTKGHFNRGVI